MTASDRRVLEAFIKSALREGNQPIQQKIDAAMAAMWKAAHDVRSSKLDDDARQAAKMRLEKIADVLAQALGDDFDKAEYLEIVKGGPNDAMADYMDAMKSGKAHGKRSKSWLGRLIKGR